MPDKSDVKPTRSIYGYYNGPNLPKPPSAFREFRDAAGKVLNRERVNQTAFLGESKPQFYASSLADTNPWFPSDADLEPFTEDPQGDPEAAKQVLEDAGWGFDDDGQLHYPADADLKPKWPEGETPAATDFPCVNPDNTYNPDWESGS